MVLEALQRPDVRIALVGASNDPAKFGNRIFRDLVAKGYAVWPVNPHEPEIEGVAAHVDLESLPSKPVLMRTSLPGLRPTARRSKSFTGTCTKTRSCRSAR